MERSLERWVIGSAAAALLLVLLFETLLAFQNTRQLREDDNWVAHTHQVMTRLENLLSLLRDAESSQRGYLLTGETTYLEPYTTALAALDAQLDALQQLTSDNPGQQARIPELRDRIAARAQTLAEAVALRSGGNLEATRRFVTEGRGRLQMEAVRSTAAEMIALEQDLLGERSQASQQTYRRALSSGLVLSVISVLGVIACLLLRRRHLDTRAAAERASAEHAERLRTTLASIGDAVIATDAEGRITTLNAVAETLTGWTREQAVGQPLDAVFRIVNEQTRQPVGNPATRALREGAVVGLANHTLLIARGGAERPIDDSAAPIRCKEGEIVGCVLVFRDVSERRRTERAQKEADRRKDEFLATLAHELRNPLAPIRSALSILRIAHGDEAVRGRAVGIMERQIAQMVRLVEDLIDLSRINRGSLELRLEPTEMTPVLQQALETCQPIAEAARHTVSLDCAAGSMRMNGDPVRLAQIFTNLLHNACKFTPAGGRIGLRAEQDGSDVVVSVQDDGIGISPDQLVGIFDLFVQESTSTERSQGGLGIGLTLVKSLVEMHGGSVEARSEGPGRGSTFVVRLPLLAQDARAAESTASANRPERALRILVVDDNRDAVESLAMLLQLSGHETHTAQDGEEAIAAAATLEPEVILLDIGLPRLDGYEVCRQIRQQAWARATVIVALTGWGQDDDLRRSSEAGFDAHLIKPVDHTALLELLADTSS